MKKVLVICLAAVMLAGCTDKTQTETSQRLQQPKRQQLQKKLKLRNPRKKILRAWMTLYDEQPLSERLYESYEGFNTESGSSCVNYDYAIWGEDTEYFITQGVI